MILKPNQRENILPLPVVLISTVSKDGMRNAALWSNFKAPSIDGCLAWAECVLEEEIAREKFVLIIGKVVHLEADDRFFNAGGSMDFQRAKPLSAMLGKDGMSFSTAKAVNCN
ncbi:MAG: flavin reductase [Methanothrix sp.]|nr:flavin reductase [Methanothrix sp.]